MIEEKVKREIISLYDQLQQEGHEPAIAMDLTRLIADLSSRRLDSQMWNVEQTAHFLRVNSSTVYELAQQGKLPHKRIGVKRGSLRFVPAELREFVRSKQWLGDSAPLATETVVERSNKSAARPQPSIPPRKPVVRAG